MFSLSPSVKRSTKYFIGCQTAWYLGIYCFQKIERYINYLPEVLSIDEFKGNAGGEKFQAIFTDLVHHKVLDILPSRTQTRIAEYIRSFKNRKQVKYFIMDMNRAYLDVALTYLPNATIVIDKFHVVRYITWALENVRKRIQKGYASF